MPFCSRNVGVTMVSRRAFLALAGSAAAAVRVSAQRRRAGGADATTLPAPIASLQSMKDRATPITVDERRARIEKARRLMVDHRIDAILLTGGTSLLYFTGVRWGISERLFGVILPAAGDPYAVCPA